MLCDRKLLKDSDSRCLGLAYFKMNFLEFWRKIESRNPGEKLYVLDKNGNIFMERRGQHGDRFWKHNQHHWLADWIVRERKTGE